MDWFEALESFGREQAGDVPVPHNFCTECLTPMEAAGVEYKCSGCGRTQIIDGELFKDNSDIQTNSIRIGTGAYKGKFYNIAGDYSKTQKKMIKDQLLLRHKQYTGASIPLNVLEAAADKYNTIQKTCEDEQKFVRRGRIKDEILAGLIYFECVRENIMRKKKDVAMFMGLPTNGFARGEDILRNLEAEGVIDIPTEDDPIDGFISRYLETLGLDKPEYAAFIRDIVVVTEKHNIGMNSQVSSKIVGAIWVLNQAVELGIAASTLERAADNTKKNTFKKFSNIILSNRRLFRGIFERHGIPQPT